MDPPVDTENIHNPGPSSVPTMSQPVDESEVADGAKPSTGPHTRRSTAIFGLGSGLSDDDSIIMGSRLPTCRQILKCMMWHVHHGTAKNKTKWESAKSVLVQVSSFYDKANIPMISERKACEKIIKLLDENAKLRAIPLKRRSAPSSLKQIEDMEEKLEQTFCLWPVNAEELIKNDEDRQFLKSMKTDRKATFGPFDLLSAKKIQRKNDREQKEDERRSRSQNEMLQTVTVIENLTESESSCDESEVSDKHVTTHASASSVSHARTVFTGTHAFFPHDILKQPKVVSLATRLKLTPSQQAAFTETLIEESGGNPLKVATLYATADRTRRKVTGDIAQTCKEQWVVPEFSTLHWDSKLLPTLSNQNVSEERLTVAVGTREDTKLLGVPSYQPGTDKKSGEIIAQLTTELLDSWGCAQTIVNMTFDTTASNTGHVSAGCIMIQQTLGRALLWSGCRHHVGEVILTHVFNDLKIEASRSPEVTLFTNSERISWFCHKIQPIKHCLALMHPQYQKKQASSSIR